MGEKQKFSTRGALNLIKFPIIECSWLLFNYVRAFFPIVFNQVFSSSMASAAKCG